MNKIKCCVIDDEPLAARLISSYIQRIPFLEDVGSFSSAQEAVKMVVDKKVDLIFLDINMPQLNGLEFARIVPSTTRVIFTTAYENYALESFKVNALDYLMKPISFEEFGKSAGRALNYFQSMDTPAREELDSIIVKSEYKLLQIPVDDIIYVEGLKDYVKIRTKDSSVMTLLNIKAIERSLPQSKFMRVHRSFIVNKQKITVIERNRIVFGNVYIPISESYKQAFSEFVSARLVGSGPRSE
ncbi:MAG: LytTR family DNA-binding domain-containing protein [Firmicutes bacterium]|nr:LytTR family DNA-binding domain-containing protein [Bacillota bacterium]MCM1401455.1 LytTR family DNA-binding domain-containing protein [Bacteroides sp.]MCM1476813.1 LytTR family DNA-binding domain-containing protein [Bacteroides sp.]